MDEAEFDFTNHASSPAPPSPKRANRAAITGSATSRDAQPSYHSRTASAVSHASSSSFAFSHTSSGFGRSGSGGAPSILPSRTRPQPLGSARCGSRDSRVGSSRGGHRVFSGASSSMGSRGGSAVQGRRERRGVLQNTQQQPQQQRQRFRERGCLAAQVRGGLAGNGRSKLGAHPSTNKGLGSEGGMSAVGVALGPRARQKNSLVHNKATQRIGRHGVQFRGRR